MTLRTLVRLAVGMSLPLMSLSDGGTAVWAAAAQAAQTRFVRPLYPQGDLRFTGQSARRTITFELGRWKAMPGSALHLFIRHSPDLDPDRSFLSVSLNYGIVRSLRLDYQDASLTEVVIPMAPELLEPENEIQFVLEQYAPPAGAPNGVWTTISGNSFIQIEGVRRPAGLDLADLPDSLVDRADGTQELFVLLPEQPSAATVEGTALLIGHLSRALLPMTARIRTTRSLRTRAPLVVVGTLQEQPLLSRLQRSGVRGDEQSLRLFTQLASVEALADREAVIGLATGPTAQRMLFVTGDSPSTVRGGATAVLQNRRVTGSIAKIGPVQGRTAQGRTVQAGATPGLREWTGYAPPTKSFSLADLTRGNLRISAETDLPLIVPINVTPDVRFFGFGHRLNLRVSVNPSFMASDARLRVAWNDAELADLSVSETFKGTVASLPIRLPAHVLRPQNILKVAWISPESGTGGASAAWLLTDTEFYLPRYYQAELPDLRFLAAHLYPFSLRPDLSDVVVVMPDRLSEALFGSLLELSAALGRMAPEDRVAFRVKRWAEMTDDDLAESHLIVLHTEDSPARLAPFATAGRPPLWLESAKRQPVVQEMISPWNSQRYALLLSAASAADLERAIVSTFSVGTLEQLKGDAAYLTPDGPVSQVLAQRRTVGGYSYFAAFEAWLGTHWMALPAILTFVSGLSFAAYRVALRYRY